MDVFEEDAKDLAEEVMKELMDALPIRIAGVVQAFAEEVVELLEEAGEDESARLVKAAMLDVLQAWKVHELVQELRLNWKQVG